MRALHPCAYQAKVVGELLLILNNVSEAALIAKCYVEVGKPLRNLCGTEAQVNLAATSKCKVAPDRTSTRLTDRLTSFFLVSMRR